MNVICRIVARACDGDFVDRIRRIKVRYYIVYTKDIQCNADVLRWCLEVDFVDDVFELSMQVVKSAIIHDEVIGSHNRSALLEVLNLGVVAFTNFLPVKRAFGAFRNAVVAEVFRGNNGNYGQFAGEFVFKDLIFGPGVESVENNMLLAGSNEIFSLDDGLLDDPVFAFFLANFFAELAFVIGSDFDAALGHFFENHAAEVDFGIAEVG